MIVYRPCLVIREQVYDHDGQGLSQFLLYRLRSAPLGLNLLVTEHPKSLNIYKLLWSFSQDFALDV